MQILCEGHPNVGLISEGFKAVVNSPEVSEEPVVIGTTPVDAYGASIYGSVIKDGGVYRMWYQAWPDNWDQNDTCQVACAESDDGITWRKPNYNAVSYDSSNNNHLTDLPFHCPSVFINPTADPKARYQAFGFVNIDTVPFDRYYMHKAASSGYYTAHSSDGIHWHLDSEEPVWPQGDVITSVWDPYRNTARVFMKRCNCINGLLRRSVYEATWKDGVLSEPASILVPDEFTDLSAVNSGFRSADFYGMGTMSTSGPTIGFLWTFKHMPPIHRWASVGRVDLSLVFQPEKGASWRHVYGRPNWLCAEDAPEWSKGALYTAAFPTEMGEYDALYFTGTRDRHGWTGVDRGYMEYLEPMKKDGGFSRIGILKWKKNRLMGFTTSLRDRIALHIPIKDFKGTVSVNVKTANDGFVRARILDSKEQTVSGYDFTDCDFFNGDHNNKVLSWNGKSVLSETNIGYNIVEVEVNKGSIYAFEFKNV